MRAAEPVPGRGLRCRPYRRKVRDQPGRTRLRVGPRADFNGDGYGDLAVAKQMRIPGDVDGAGYGLVQVLYGTPDGFRPAASQQWSRADLGGPPGRSSFGAALAHGDFDGDGFSDLVVSDPHDSAVIGGSLQLLYGSAGGLTRARVQEWSLDSSGLPGQAKEGDRFGWALTVGDLGRSSHDDLVIGIPNRKGSGAVLVLFGGSDGVAVEGHHLWDQATEGIPGRAERLNSSFLLRQVSLSTRFGRC